MADVQHSRNNSDINGLLKKLGKFSPSYSTMSPTVKSLTFDRQCSAPELPPRRREFHNPFYMEACYKRSDSMGDSITDDDENDSDMMESVSPSDNQKSVVNDRIEHNIINDELYAVVDKNTINRKRALKGNNQNCPINNETEVNKEIAEAFGDCQIKQRVGNRHKAHNRPVSDGMINPQCLIDGKLHVRPPVPRPYSSEHKWDLPTHMEEPIALSSEMHSDLDCRRQNSISVEDMLCSREHELEYNDKNSLNRVSLTEHRMNNRHSGDFMYYLPLQKDRSSSFEGLTMSQNEAELRQLREFKKKHRRMRSHESFDKTFHTSSNGTVIDKSLQKSGEINNMSDCDKSEEDLGRLLSSSRENGSEASRDSQSDEVAEFFRRASDLETEGLPEGWQEVREGAETYYWHIWTGTIQYERPTLSQTTGSSSRSISPFSGNGSAHSSRTSSLTSDPFEEKNAKSTCMSTSEPRDKTKQSISFPVHSMGWMDVDEEAMSPEHIGNTVNNCIATLAEKRHDLWKMSETWANGEDINLVLEGEALKLIEAKGGITLHVQPIARMRVWGVGRAETRDFAYIARDQSTSKHRCHMFRCHGHLSARSITNALHAICNRVLDEKRKAKEKCENPPHRTTPSDLMKPPSKSGNAFNEKPYAEQKRCFTAKYVGSSEVPKCSGVDVINKTVASLTEGQQSSDWSSCLLEVTTSEIRTIDCIKQLTTLEHRVRFISFLGVAHDERFGAYIVAAGKECFICNVFFCAPHAGNLMKALEEACKLRFEKLLAGKVLSKPVDPIVSPSPEPESIIAKAVYNPTAQSGTHSSLGMHPPVTVTKSKTKTLSSSIAGVFNKLNKKDSKKKEEEVNNSLSFIPGPNENLVKYFGSVPVDIGCGVDTVQRAVNDLAGGEMMIGYIEILSDCVSLSDSQRTALSKRFFDFNTISYCGMTSDRKHFGIIVSRGKGKYICHVFEEYKVNCGDIVSAIHEVL